MTREHKLALIVGFSLVLLVGVLISDHFSRVRLARLETVQSDDPEIARAEPGITAPPPTLPGRDEAPSPGASALQATPIVEIAQGSGINRPGQTPETSPRPTAGADDLESAIENAGGRIVRTADGGTLLVPPPAGGGAAGTTPGSGTAAVREPAATVGSSNPEPKPTSPGPAMPTAYHQVVKGESLYQIAKAHYGSGNLWKQLAEHNKTVVGADGSVREGVRIALPPKAVLTGKAEPGPAPTAAPAKESTKTPAKPPASRPGARPTALATYTVKDGDTLGHIAQKVLGSARRAGDLLAANTDQLDDADAIRAGMVLKVPSR